MFKIDVRCTDPETVKAAQVEEPEYDGSTTTPELQNFFLYGRGLEEGDEGKAWLNWGGRLVPEEVAQAVIGLDNEIGAGGAFTERVMTTLARLGGFDATFLDETTTDEGGLTDD